ncbi:MAG: hypothetical protein GVY35_17530 [Bacteroidetes bacterium]|nr:hypothetical protein [Bacteroidota bacterium]
MTYLASCFDTDARSVSSLLRTLTAVVSVALLMGLAAPAAQAQSTTPSSDDMPRWSNTFEQQVERLLDASATEEMQARGMQLVIEFSDQYGSTFNFSTVRPELYDILFNYTNSDDLRILALSALNATGAVANSQTLAQSIEDEPSERVERHLKIALEEK